PRQLFSEVFQTTIPWEWQAAVIARYLVVDRKAGEIVFLGRGREPSTAVEPTRAAVEYWGGRLSNDFTIRSIDRFGPGTEAIMVAAHSDAVVAFDGPGAIRDDVDSIQRAVRQHAPVSAPSSLLVSRNNSEAPRAGATACYTYTWAGWAQAIPRVAKFRRMFNRRFGRFPEGLEQEGYDAVRIIADGLKRTHGKGGRSLTAAIERLPTRTYSSFPIDFGPDDHLFLPRDELGLFAVPAPHERLEPWQRRGDSNLWRPVMRTFTEDGKRTNIPDHDKRVFFPFWRKNRPAPFYWQSRYGIRTKASDPVH
ncbi:MAG TPA: hypothetical protein VF660_11385, partial [Actinomycetota bacterium]